MEIAVRDMSSLFAQLGEPGDEVAIARFIEVHRPIAGGIRLHEADFWSPAQANFLREAIQDDSDWAAVVDELNAELHAQG